MKIVKRKRTVVIVARHGERLDYQMLQKGLNWLSTAERPFDPPLSELGWKQGAAMGTYIQECLEDLALPPVKQVYASPFLRCRETAVAANSTFSTATTKVKVELGLAESLNESWYRSWALPTSNGTWGYRERNKNTGETLPVDEETLHPKAHQSVTSIIYCPEQQPLPGVDTQHQPLTTVQKDYSWGNFESQHEQRKRMKRVIEAVAQENSSVLLVSHGGPVTHCYAALTGNSWRLHGEASYASFTIYEKTIHGKWVALLMNEKLT